MSAEEARRIVKEHGLERRIAEIVAAAPPPTDEQREKLRRIFRP